MSGRNVVRAMRESGSLGQPKRSGNLLDIVLATVAAAAVVSCGVVAVNWYLSPHSSKPPAAASVAAGKVVEWTEADTKFCENRAREAASEDNGDQFGLTERAVTEGGYAMIASRVTCHASTKIARLCDSTARAELVAMINDYVSRYDLVVGGLHLQGAPMTMMGGMLGGEAQFGAGVYGSIKENTLSYMAVYHDRVVDSLHKLAEAGVLSASDFGVFGVGISGTLVPAFKDVAVTNPTCT